jgi:hypothetical protein
MPPQGIDRTDALADNARRLGHVAGIGQRLDKSPLPFGRPAIAMGKTGNGEEEHLGYSTYITDMVICRTELSQRVLYRLW